MDEEDKEYLLDKVAQYRQGVCNLDDVTWSFVIIITNRKEAAFYNLATEEIKEEIHNIVQKMEEHGKYVVFIAGVGERDVTERIILLKELLLLSRP